MKQANQRAKKKHSTTPPPTQQQTPENPAVQSPVTAVFGLGQPAPEQQTHANSATRCHAKRPQDLPYDPAKDHPVCLTLFCRGHSGGMMEKIPLTEDEFKKLLFMKTGDEEGTPLWLNRDKLCGWIADAIRGKLDAGTTHARPSGNRVLCEDEPVMRLYRQDLHKIYGGLDALTEEIQCAEALIKSMFDHFQATLEVEPSAEQLLNLLALSRRVNLRDALDHLESYFRETGYEESRSGTAAGPASEKGGRL